MSNEILVQATHVKKWFPIKKWFFEKQNYVKAVDDVSLTLYRGETLGIVGESGCGKSTLARTLLRLIEPTGGEIIFNGEDISKLSERQMRKMRQKIQIIFQDPFSSLNPSKTVMEAIAEPMRVHKLFKTEKEVEARVLELMELVGLSERLINSYPHELDGGRRQRVGIARALALNPEFIVCDEPVSALDVSIQAQILNLMKKLQKEMNLTYIFITHDLSVVNHFSDEIAVMYLGQIVEKAPAEELFQNPLHPYTKALLSAIPVPKIWMRDKEIQTIKGEVKSPINVPEGCRFAGRCDHACAKCMERTPELKDYGNGHFCACARIEEDIF